jgi:hypothetical protein
MPLHAPDDATAGSQGNYPSTGAIVTREFIVLDGGGQSGAHGRGLALDRRIDEIALYADEDGAQVEAGEHILIDRTCRCVGQRSRPRHNSTHEPADRAVAVHFPYGRRLKKAASARGITLKPGREALACKAPKCARKLGMAERIDQVGDVVTKQPDEDGVLVFRIDRLTFVDRVTN